MHLLLLLLWPKPSIRSIPQESIAVSLLPASEDKGARPSPAPKEPAARPFKGRAQIAKRISPALEERLLAPREVPAQKEPKREEAPFPTREPIPDKATLAERALPTLKELLPPVGWSASGQRTLGAEGPVRLDTKNPQFVTYFNSIKRSIELVWQYPELALKHGLQGKLLLEFSILGSGDLESARILRSSGSSLLDEEALRAVKAAAPFGPIPPWIGKSRIDIVASFEYLDNRLNYRFTP